MYYLLKGHNRLRSLIFLVMLIIAACAPNIGSITTFCTHIIIEYKLNGPVPPGGFTFNAFHNGRVVGSASENGTGPGVNRRVVIRLNERLPDNSLVEVRVRGGGNPLAALPAQTCDGSDTAAGPPATNLFDGRINDYQDRDVAAPIAIYVVDGVIRIFGIDPDDGNGHLDLEIPPDLLESIGVPSEDQHHFDIASGNIQATGQALNVYRLWTGEIQINTYYHDGKSYSVIWPVGLPDGLYHLAA
ncbi:MAG: hypothetical protein D6737_08595 [Chloroflexi bacterium]|nr:MAG: hypothetical protein D6737_08595 [Chloroflexota bacterium]